MLTETRWWTVAEVAERLRLERSDVYKLIKRGQLPAKKISVRRIRVSEQDLAEFMQSRENAKD